MSLESIVNEARAAAYELCELASLKAGQIVIVGCSSSEILGRNVGSCSSPETGTAVFNALNGVFSERGVFLAAQCCEHLNRCVVIEREADGRLEPVNAVPIPKAGGSFAAAAFTGLNDPIVVEEIRADAGMDIGGTLIGMHLKRVAVPLRLTVRQIGAAHVTAARTRPKLIGGARTVYGDSMA